MGLKMERVSAGNIKMYTATQNQRDQRVFGTKMNVIEDKLANILAEKAADRDP